MRAARGWLCIGLVALSQAMLALGQVNERSGTEQVLERFQAIRQPDLTSCGPTSAAMVLRYYGRDEATAWAELGRLPQRVALMSPRGLERTLEAGGVDVAVRCGYLTDLTAAIDDDRPAILLVRIGPSMWHYVVIFGYRDEGAEFLLADPHGWCSWIDAAILDRAWSFDGDLEGRTIEQPMCAPGTAPPRQPTPAAARIPTTPETQSA